MVVAQIVKVRSDSTLAIAKRFAFPISSCAGTIPWEPFTSPCKAKQQPCCDFAFYFTPCQSVLFGALWSLAHSPSLATFSTRPVWTDSHWLTNLLRWAWIDTELLLIALKMVMLCFKKYWQFKKKSSVKWQVPPGFDQTTDGLTVVGWVDIFVWRPQWQWIASSGRGTLGVSLWERLGDLWGGTKPLDALRCGPPRLW